MGQYAPESLPKLTPTLVKRLGRVDLVRIVSDDELVRHYSDPELERVLKELERRDTAKDPQMGNRWNKWTVSRLRQWAAQTKAAPKQPPVEAYLKSKNPTLKKAGQKAKQAVQQKKQEDREWRISAQNLKLSEVKAYYYSKRVQILRSLKLHNVAIKLFPKRGKGKPIFIRHPRGKPTQWIRIRTWTEMEKWLNQKAVEFYPEINYPDNSLLLPIYVIDLDVPNRIPSKIQKRVVQELRINMARLPEVYRAEISHTGGRGWHIEGRLRKRVHWETAKERVRKVVILFTLQMKPSLAKWVTQERRKAARGRRIYLDIDVMRPRGVLRAPYCIHAKTGRIKLPVSVTQLASFRPRGARTELRRAMYPQRRKKK